MFDKLSYKFLKISLLLCNLAEFKNSLFQVFSSQEFISLSSLFLASVVADN